MYKKAVFVIQLNKPSLNKIFKDFDTCPDSNHGQPAAMEIWQRICDTGSVLYAIDFHSDEALKQSKKELCALNNADLEHMYQAFRAQFSIQRFFIQVGRLFKMEIHDHLCKCFKM